MKLETHYKVSCALIALCVISGLIAIGYLLSLLL